MSTRWVKRQISNTTDFFFFKRVSFAIPAKSSSSSSQGVINQRGARRGVWRLHQSQAVAFNLLQWNADERQSDEQWTLPFPKKNKTAPTYTHTDGKQMDGVQKLETLARAAFARFPSTPHLTCGINALIPRLWGSQAKSTHTHDNTQSLTYTSTHTVNALESIWVECVNMHAHTNDSNAGFFLKITRVTSVKNKAQQSIVQWFCIHFEAVFSATFASHLQRF